MWMDGFIHTIISWLLYDVMWYAIGLFKMVDSVFPFTQADVCVSQREQIKPEDLAVFRSLHDDSSVDGVAAGEHVPAVEGVVLDVKLCDGHLPPGSPETSKNLSWRLKTSDESSPNHKERRVLFTPFGISSHLTCFSSRPDLQFTRMWPPESWRWYDPEIHVVWWNGLLCCHFFSKKQLYSN